MTASSTPDDRAADDTPTETHHEPHGSAAPHGAVDDVAEHEMDEAHGEALGPIDVMAWSAGAGGILLGLLVAACLVIAGSG